MVAKRYTKWSGLLVAGLSFSIGSAAMEQNQCSNQNVCEDIEQHAIKKIPTPNCQPEVVRIEHLGGNTVIKKKKVVTTYTTTERTDIDKETVDEAEAERHFEELPVTKVCHADGIDQVDLQDDCSQDGAQSGYAKTGETLTKQHVATDVTIKKDRRKEVLTETTSVNTDKEVDESEEVIVIENKCAPSEMYVYSNCQSDKKYKK